MMFMPCVRRFPELMSIPALTVEKVYESRWLAPIRRSPICGIGWSPHLCVGLEANQEVQDGFQPTLLLSKRRQTTHMGPSPSYVYIDSRKPQLDFGWGVQRNHE